LIEDDLTLGELFVTALGKSGHGVCWFVRARISEDVTEGLVVTDPDGNETGVDPARFELALVDWRLKGSPIDGDAVTAFLTARGLPAVGISGLSQLNQQMVEAGARGGISKDELFSGIISGRIVIDRDYAGKP
jgi:hypothetical protein